MLLGDGFHLDVSKIDLVHEFVLDRAHRCEYPHGRGMYGIVHCISGTAEFRFDFGDNLTIKKGDTLLLSPYAIYSIYTQKEFRHYTVNFKAHQKTSQPDILNAPYRLLNSTAADQFVIRLNKLNKTWASKSLGYEMLSISQLYALLYLFYIEYKSQELPTESAARLRPAKEKIELCFNQPISLEILAKYCNMSVTNFRREWKKTYNSTPLQYRDEIRLSHSRDLLVSGIYSVSEVAERCGFENTGYFIRFFKKHTGLTPAQFKKQSIII